MTSNSKITLRDLMAVSEKIDGKLDVMSKRVTALEVWKGTIQGKIAVIVGCASLIFMVVWEYVKEKINH